MNERIRELAADAQQVFNKLDENYNEMFEAFAQSMVRQMLAITDAHTEVFQSDRDRALVEHIKQSVKLHFGVDQ